MRTRVALASCSAALVAVAVLAGTTAAAPTRDALIRPGIGVSKIRLGMTAAQLRKAMGPPESVIKTKLSFGRSRIEYQYAIGSYSVHLTGRRGRERVVAVATWFAGERTRAGIGVGALETVARQKYAKLRCTPHHRNTWPVGTFTGQVAPYVQLGRLRWCYLPGPGGVQTVFVVHGPTVLIGQGLPGTREQLEEDWRREAKVFSVIVRAAEYKHPDERAPD